MKLLNAALAASAVGVSLVSAHGSHGSEVSPEAEAQADQWIAQYGHMPDLSFSGINTFAHLPHVRCLNNVSHAFDVAILGAPFDTAVSYRPGARFGPFGIRAGSRRHIGARGYSIPYSMNPYTTGIEIVDCGDIPISPYDNALAYSQIEAAYGSLLSRRTSGAADEQQLTVGSRGQAKDGREHPKIITLGGDHSVVLPILRSLNKVYGEISVIHFDAHLDTWDGSEYPGAVTANSEITHGSFFWKASVEGLVSRTSSIHAGIRTKLQGYEDLKHDDVMGFQIITTDDIEEMRVKGIVEAIKRRVKDTPCYLSIDIDVIDPGSCPGTGTPEPGGWTTRELKGILRGLTGLNLVGMDVVEVAPAYDTNAEQTTMVAADLVHEMLSLLQLKDEPVPSIKGTKLAPQGQVQQGKTVARDEL